VLAALLLVMPWGLGVVGQAARLLQPRWNNEDLGREGYDVLTLLRRFDRDFGSTACAYLVVLALACLSRKASEGRVPWLAAGAVFCAVVAAAASMKRRSLGMIIVVQLVVVLLLRALQRCASSFPPWRPVAWPSRHSLVINALNVPLAWFLASFQDDAMPVSGREMMLACGLNGSAMLLVA